MSETNVLTLEIATRLLSDRHGAHFSPFRLRRYESVLLDLSRFKQIDVEAARYLVSQGHCAMRLGALNSVSPELANALAIHRNAFVFGDAQALSPALAKALAGERNMLVLESASALALATAKYLVTGQLLALTLDVLPDTLVEAINAERDSFDWDRHPPNDLIVRSNARLDETSAAALGSVRNVFLDNISELSSEAAKELSNVQGDLSLNGLSELPEGVADALGNKNGGELCLDGVREFSDAAAQRLFRRHGGFSLNGLLSLSQTAAHALGQTSGLLHLNALESLPDEVAVEVAKRDGQLFLNGLKELSATAATALAKQKVEKNSGSLSLAGLTHLSPTVAKALSKAKHYSLNVSGIKTLDSATAKVVAEFKTKVLDLNGLCSLSADAALELIGYRGQLAIDDDNFEKLAPDARRVLGKHRSFR